MAGTIETPVQQICEFLKLVSRGGVFETRLLRCKTRSGRPFTMSGYWNDPLAAAEDLVEADQEYEAAASYVTLNAINPALLSRASNRLEQYPENTTSDADVVKRTRLGNGRSRPRFAAGRCYRFRGCRRQRPGWSCRQCLNRHDRLASPRRLCPGRLWGQPLAPVPRLVRAGCAGHLRLCRASRRRPGSWGGRGSSLCAESCWSPRRSASPAAFSAVPPPGFAAPRRPRSRAVVGWPSAAWQETALDGPTLVAVLGRVGPDFLPWVALSAVLQPCQRASFLPPFARLGGLARCTRGHGHPVRPSSRPRPRETGWSDRRMDHLGRDGAPTHEAESRAGGRPATGSRRPWGTAAPGLPSLVSPGPAAG